jgi:hypothetical protein
MIGADSRIRDDQIRIAKVFLVMTTQRVSFNRHTAQLSEARGQLPGGLLIGHGDHRTGFNQEPHRLHRSPQRPQTHHGRATAF